MLTAIFAVLAGLALSAQPARSRVTVYKTATCGCCTKWVDHMRAGGFDVTAQNVDDIAAVKKTLGVPPELGSCHTSVVDGYVVEGHVPADSIKRLLRERPKFAGLAVPGMPVGTPGMEMEGKRDPYSVLSFDQSGRYVTYERH